MLWVRETDHTGNLLRTHLRSDAEVPAAPRIQVKKAFHVDQFGPRGPLLLCAPPAASEAAEQAKEGASEAAPPAPQVASRTQSTPKVVGWCTVEGCSEAAVSWKSHVLHYQRCHLDPSDDRSVCSLCLSRVSSYEDHSVLHRINDVRCTACEARFVYQEALRKHWIQFHRRNPPETPAASQAASTPLSRAVPALSAASTSSTAATASHAPSAPPSSSRSASKDRGPARTVEVGWCSVKNCGQAFTSWKDYVNHHMSSHIKAAQRGVTCVTCLDVYPTGGLADHLEAHSRGEEQCSLCTARFIGAASLMRHKRDFHHVTRDGNLPAFVPASVHALAPDSTPATQGCSLGNFGGLIGRCTAKGCQSMFRSWEDFVAHFKATHCRKGSGNCQVCHLCLTRLSTADDASRHMAKHSKGKGQGHPCKKCSARFFKTKRLNNHISTFHSIC
ncbi:zinc finger and SCAN domain-containing protein 10-like isoform X2 [Thrips palmi]|uniref:Zinc finger and SCAN domain-containing protein 10-like isoform X2 n=1 Tax=Thrips palmi TaxID=161013 RepID=A0A6P8YC05_THRPL|nr:zinc finger and SCAN domain-containing protein 10-like isoform X2 [Thrips palmi]